MAKDFKEIRNDSTLFTHGNTWAIVLMESTELMVNQTKDLRLGKDIWEKLHADKSDILWYYARTQEELEKKLDNSIHLPLYGDMLDKAFIQDYELNAIIV